MLIIVSLKQVEADIRSNIIKIDKHHTYEYLRDKSIDEKIRWYYTLIYICKRDKLTKDNMLYYKRKLSELDYLGVLVKD